MPFFSFKHTLATHPHSHFLHIASRNSYLVSFACFPTFSLSCEQRRNLPSIIPFLLTIEIPFCNLHYLKPKPSNHQNSSIPSTSPSTSGKSTTSTTNPNSRPSSTNTALPIDLPSFSPPRLPSSFHVTNSLPLLSPSISSSSTSPATS